MRGVEELAALKLELLSLKLTALELATQVRILNGERMDLATIVHGMALHPEYEYATTKGPRKSFYDENVPPEGEGWVRNAHKGRGGWERFDFHEEAYWMRPVSSEEEGG